jgi:hypothetical protein
VGEDISRRRFIKNSALVWGAFATTNILGSGKLFGASKDNARVFFPRDINFNGLLKIYSDIGQDIPGKTGIKLHTVEPQAPDILPRDSSTDIPAVEQASIDMMYGRAEAELHDPKERIESRKGLRQLSYMKEMKIGTDRYELIAL